jgi:hypothetical protein
MYAAKSAEVASHAPDVRPSDRFPSQGSTAAVLHAADVVQRVLPKNGQRCKQYLSRVVRRFQKSGSKEFQDTTMRVGEVITLDYCPKELFMVNEIEGYIDGAAAK